MIRIHTLIVGQMHTNCYLAEDTGTGDTVIIDPGEDAEFITDRLISLGAKPVAIVATHGHFDHIMAAYSVQAAFGLPFFIHPADVFLLERMQSSARHFLGHGQVDPPPEVTAHLEGTRMRFGSVIFDLLHVPGHTPGSVALYSKTAGVVFTGDTVFAGGLVGRTDFAYADRNLLTRSIGSILALPGPTVLLSGHGDATTVGQAKTARPV